MQVEPRAVIHDTDNRILPTATNGLTRQVNAPGAVLATRLALAMTDPSAHVGDLVSVPFEGLCNVCLADRHVAFGGVHSIEEVGDITATQVWLHGLEPNDFRRYPIR